MMLDMYLLLFWVDRHSSSSAGGLAFWSTGHVCLQGGVRRRQRDRWAWMAQRKPRVTVYHLRTRSPGDRAGAAATPQRRSVL